MLLVREEEIILLIEEISEGVVCRAACCCRRIVYNRSKSEGISQINRLMLVALPANWKEIRATPMQCCSSCHECYVMLY